jgi:6-phosphogluconolactonase
VTIPVEVLPSAEEAAAHAASLVAEALRAAVADRGRGSVAFSGGSTSAPMLLALGDEDVPWPDISVFQVDERVAASGHPDRNLTTHLLALPEAARASIRPMPVEDPDLEQAALRYGELLPERLDIVHLGLGADGHTASLVPGDAVLDVDDRLVAVTGEYEGYRRMTLTFRALETARQIVWLVTGEDKRDALGRLLERDLSIPATRVESPAQRVVADERAAPP